MATDQTFFFYDLETSGLDPRRQRIMQFAGQRTSLDLKDIGDPVNIMVALTEEILPDPGAILVTGITPQKTLEEGYTEAEFSKLIQEQVFTPNTIVVGFNNVRFDDEFIRYTFWRNFHDPYEWAWADGRSRWDLLDVIRLMRAIRPEGMEWPVDADGKPTNRLELLTKANNLSHEAAHDALSDVQALIDVARLIRDKQPRLFDYMLKLRDKKAVGAIVNPDKPQPFVYASGRYDNAHLKTTVAYPLGPGNKPGSVLVYDLRFDPTPFLEMPQQKLAEALFSTADERKKKKLERPPVKELSLNRCPAVAPLSVLDRAAQERISLSLDTVEKHAALLAEKPDYIAAIVSAYGTRPPFEGTDDVDAKLYDDFIDSKDKPYIAAVRAADASRLVDFHPSFSDPRLDSLLVRYKARNYQSALNQAEREEWETYKTQRLQEDLPKFLKQLQTAAAKDQPDDKKFLLQELQLWAESIAPLE